MSSGLTGGRISGTLNSTHDRVKTYMDDKTLDPFPLTVVGTKDSRSLEGVVNYRIVIGNEEFMSRSAETAPGGETPLVSVLRAHASDRFPDHLDGGLVDDGPRAAGRIKGFR